MEENKKTLAEAGELAFIRRIRLLMPKAGGNIVRSVGDDCFVARSFGPDYMAVTTDTFVDEVHFTRRFFTWRQVGVRCMTASVSDIAAMSGLPEYSVLSLSMPPEMLLGDAVDLFTGLAETGTAYGAPIVGGETTSTPGPLTITVTVIGRTEPDRMVTRSGGRPGDSVYVTGHLGDAMAGLLAFQAGEAGFEYLRERFVRPEAKIGFSRRLTGQFHISAMIDLSDGLASDLGHICEESACGAEVRADALPLSQPFRDLLRQQGKDPVGFAITSGEDYGILFTSGDPALSGAVSAVGGMGSADALHIGGELVTRIGTLTDRPGEMLLVRGDGAVEPIHSKGYEHFKNEL
jgi:thiamine-monophosphate kinase